MELPARRLRRTLPILTGTFQRHQARRRFAPPVLSADPSNGGEPALHAQPHEIVPRRSILPPPQQFFHVARVVQVEPQSGQGQHRMGRLQRFQAPFV